MNSPRAFFSTGGIVHDCVRRFGDRIISSHIKDIKLQEPAGNVRIYDVIPGEGNIDFHTYIRELHKLPQEVPFLLEPMDSEEHCNQAVAYIRKCANEENIAI